MNSDIKSDIELYFKLCCDWKKKNIEVTKFMYNMCGRLKDKSALFLGLYHFHTLTSDEHNSFVRDFSNESERDHQAFEIFIKLAKIQLETIETYYAWYMIGQCYNIGVSVAEDRDKAYHWFKKAGDKGIAIACSALGDMYRDDKMFDKSIVAFEGAYNYGIDRAANFLFRLYASEPAIKDLNKAYYWSTKVTHLDSISRTHLIDILATGQFEWTQQHHQYWSHLKMTFVMEKTTFKKENSTVLHQITFTDQVFMILLISKFRTHSNFSFTNFLTKDIWNKYH